MKQTLIKIILLLLTLGIFQGPAIAVCAGESDFDKLTASDSLTNFGSAPEEHAGEEDCGCPFSDCQSSCHRCALNPILFPTSHALPALSSDQVLWAAKPLSYLPFSYSNQLLDPPRPV